MLTPHLTMKFPNQSGNIVTIKVNQVEAHNCSTKSLLVKPYTLASMKHVDAGVLIMWKALHRARPILTQGEMRKTRGQHQPRSCVVSSKEPHQMHQDRGKTWWAPSETDWGLADMPDIDPNFICHKLFIFLKAKPVAQQRWKLSDECWRAVKEETEKLINVGFIREVMYSTRLSNIVMVKKSNGKWRICVDYTDLNKPCLKDAYSLPNINRLIDGACGY